MDFSTNEKETQNDEDREGGPESSLAQEYGERRPPD